MTSISSRLKSASDCVEELRGRERRSGFRAVKSGVSDASDAGDGDRGSGCSTVLGDLHEILINIR
jgi:hypothetical protein